jgi:hypothetical protein
VSDYPNPKDRLAAVAADVREMAKVLSSKHGIFPAKGVTVLTDKQATRDSVLAALRSVFDGPSIETVFVYLAGHGFGIGRRYYYVAYDTTSEATAVPLTEIKAISIKPRVAGRFFGSTSAMLGASLPEAIRTTWMPSSGKSA